MTRNDRQRDRGSSRLAAARKTQSVFVRLRTICLPAKYRELMPQLDDLQLLELG